jgi:OmcA/MtrC family decaheme c-type cytochrome
MSRHQEGESDMHGKDANCLRRPGFAALLALLLVFAPAAHGQSLEWGAAKYFQYNIENVLVKRLGTTPESYQVKVVFSVTNPMVGDTWNIKGGGPFYVPAGANMSLDIAWDPSADVTNTGSENLALSSVFTPTLGKGAAIPVQVRQLQNAATVCTDLTACPGATSLTNRYWIQKTVQPVSFVSAVTRGRVAIEGRLICDAVPGYSCPAPNYIPVRSVVANIDFMSTNPDTAVIGDARRAVVDIRKCQLCHDDQKHGDTVVPRLGLHGGNRNENLGLCVTCHNPNQTDVPYRRYTTGTTLDTRISGPEVPIDFKTMVHSIHSGGFREQPFVVVGFGSSVNDFSGVRFPSELRNCMNCHVEVSGKGTFELPLSRSVLGTTVKTQSAYLGTFGLPPAVTTRAINVDPRDDTRISPTAAVCSSCHDKAEVRDHMIRRGGASFATTQAAIGTTVVERCANCHGPGKDRDVRKVHQIGGSGSDD